MGAGDSQLNVSGMNLIGLDLTTGAGAAVVNLTGDWQNDLTANIQGGVGNLTLLLPQNSGVQVHVTGGLGSVVATGLTREEDVFVNEAFGEAQPTLTINVTGAVGEITMEVEE